MCLNLNWNDLNEYNYSICEYLSAGRVCTQAWWPSSWHLWRFPTLLVNIWLLRWEQTKLKGSVCNFCGYTYIIDGYITWLWCMDHRLCGYEGYGWKYSIFFLLVKSQGKTKTNYHKYSLEQQMCINPQQKRVPNKCTIHSCLTNICQKWLITGSFIHSDTVYMLALFFFFGLSHQSCVHPSIIVNVQEQFFTSI